MKGDKGPWSWARLPMADAMNLRENRKTAWVGRLRAQASTPANSLIGYPRWTPHLVFQAFRVHMLDMGGFYMNVVAETTIPDRDVAVVVRMATIPVRDVAAAHVLVVDGTSSPRGDAEARQRERRREV